MNPQKCFLIITVILLLSSCSRNKENGWAEFGLKGKVSSYTETEYDVELKSDEWQAGAIQSYSENRFDNRGIYLGTDYFKADGSPSTKVITKTDKGRTIENITYNKEGEIIERWKYNHLSKTKSEFTSFDRFEEETSKGYILYKKGLVIQLTKEVMPQNERYKTFFFEYTRNNNLKEWTVVSTTGQSAVMLVCKYLEFDKKGNWITRLNYNFDNDEPRALVKRDIEYFE